MPAYVRLQEREFELEAEGYTATRHQREVGAGYFDAVAQTTPAASRPRCAQGLDRGAVQKARLLLDDLRRLRQAGGSPSFSQRLVPDGWGSGIAVAPSRS
jgi:hypothetical protein